MRPPLTTKTDSITDRPSGNARVCMIVWNDFLHDARVTKEAETLAAAGYDLTVLALHSPGKTREREQHPGGFRVIRVTRLGPLATLWNRVSGRAPTPPPPGGRGVAGLLTLLVARLAAHTRLLREAFKLRARVYHAHDVNVLPTTWLAARLRRAVLVYDAHEISTSREGYQKIEWLVKPVESYLVHRARAMITTTDLRADFFQQSYGVQRPLVLQNRPRQLHPPVSRRLRDRLGIADHDPIVIYQGGLQQGRGLRNLVASVALWPRGHLVLIGSGRQQDTLRDDIAARRLEARVHMLATVPLDELPAYTASADIGIQVLRNTCLNHYTTDSNKLFEYLMAGLPVVASDFPEIRKVVEGYDVGLLVDPEDIGAIAAAVQRLMDDSGLYRRQRANALAAAPNLSWEAQEQALVDLYRGLEGVR